MRRASVVPSRAVIAKAAATAKATPKAAAVKTPAVKAATQPAARPVWAAAPTVKPKAAKKLKLVRDSFTIPKAEYVVLDELKQRAAKLAQPVKKSELLRAGIKALAAMSDTAFRVALKDVPAIKTGRPASDK